MMFLFNHKGVFFWLFCLILGVGSFPRVQAYSLAQPTQFKTPTPAADGRIFYIVQKEDTLWSIAAISGIPVEQLREMNSLRQNETISEGQRIYLGMGGPASFSPTPAATDAPPTSTPTPVPEKGTASLCLLLYDDVNGDALRQETEVGIPKGALSISSVNGEFSISKETEGSMAAQCFDNLQPGEYNISVAVPDGYNPTILTNYRITLKAGDISYVDFGAQSRSVPTAIPFTQPEDTSPTSDSGGVIPILGIMGALFLLLGVGMAVYAVRLRR